MTSVTAIRELCVAALTGATDAGQNVCFARSWPTQPGSYPVLLVPPLKSDGESWGANGAPSFTTTATLRVIARVQEPAQPGDVGSRLAAIAIESLGDQVLAAIINNPTLIAPAGPIQQFSRFSCEPSLTPDGEQALAEIVVEVDLVFVRGPEDFFQATSILLQGFDAGVQEPAGTVSPGFSITLPSQ
jgi:hypothetical protein